MTCTACGEHPKENTAKGFPKAVVEINNPETLVLLRKVVIPASMGDETAFPPAIGKYFNVLLHYEASGNNYLYSSDGIPTEIGANVPSEVINRIEALEDGYDDLVEDYEQLQSQVGDVSEALSAETSARELADGNLQSEVGNVSEALSAETSARENADIGLQGQIDAITSSSDVKDIVGTYTELQNYDTSTLGNDDIIKVLQDSTHNNAMTYYRWIISGGAGSWQYIGEEGPYYTKSETETLLNNKQDEITSSNKLLSDLVDDTNQTNKFVTENEKTTWNTEIENLQEEDELLKRNLQTTTGSGEEVTLEKTTELDFVKPPLPRGNTKQNTTTGKNLLPPLDSGSLNGLTFTTNSNGITTISGTTTSVTTYFNNVNKILPAGTYTLSINLSYTPPANSSQLILQDINNVRLATINLWKITSKTFTLSADTEIKNYYLFSNSGIQHNGTISIQLEEGSTATSYEPYTGGQPSPNPSYPQEVEVVTGNVGVTISNENNTESKTLPVSLGNIELCKIGDYQDYIYKNEGNWYVHKNIIKIDLSTITNYIHTPGWRNPTSFVADNVFNHGYSGYTTVASLFCNRLIADTPARITGSVINAIGLGRNSSIYLSVEGITTSNALITYFSQNPTYLYAPLATPTDTEITDTTLISQLEEISKTLSYQGQTNITSNTIALFDVEAYQSTKLILEDLDLTKLSTFDSTKTQVLKNVNGTLTWVDE